MKLLECISKMLYSTTATQSDIKSFLEESIDIIVADKNNYGDIMIKYALFIKDSILYVAKMSDSSNDKVVLTLESAAIYSDDYMDILWQSYLSKRSIFFADIDGLLKNSSIRSGEFTFESIQRIIKDKTVFYFNDPYSSLE
mgnify:CR=1 FL=1